jgi:hypothetical protein
MNRLDPCTPDTDRGAPIEHVESIEGSRAFASELNRSVPEIHAGLLWRPTGSGLRAMRSAKGCGRTESVRWWPLLPLDALRTE